jgi:hypothetical protein
MEILDTPHEYRLLIPPNLYLISLRLLFASFIHSIRYMELRTKLDFTRQSTGKDVIKYKAQASTLRAKWAMLSATVMNPK